MLSSSSYENFSCFIHQTQNCGRYHVAKRVIDFVQLPHGPWNNDACLFLSNLCLSHWILYTYTWLHVTFHIRQLETRAKRNSVLPFEVSFAHVLDVAYFTWPIVAYSLCVFPFLVWRVTQMFSAVHM